MRDHGGMEREEREEGISAGQSQALRSVGNGAGHLCLLRSNICP